MIRSSFSRGVASRNRRGLRIAPCLSVYAWALGAMLEHSRLSVADLERGKGSTSTKMRKHLERFGWTDDTLKNAIDELKAAVDA